MGRDSIPRSDVACSQCGGAKSPIIITTPGGYMGGSSTVYRCPDCDSDPVEIPFYRIRDLFRFRRPSGWQESSPAFDNAARIIEDHDIE